MPFSLHIEAGAGTSAAPFLKIDAGARASAMGGAFVALADDSNAIFHNPAGMALLDRKEVGLAHNEWFEGIKSENLSYGHPLGPASTLGFGANLFLSGSMDKYNENGIKTGSFDFFEGAFSIGLALDMGKGFYAGAAAKNIYQKTDSEKAFAYAGDLGFIYNQGSLNLGAALQNLGSEMKLYKESFDLPFGFLAGAAYRVKNYGWLTLEISGYNDARTAFSAGAEGELPVNVREMIFLRAGFVSGRSRDAGSGLSAGIGIRNQGLRIDYAFVPFGELGNSHKISMSFKFGPDREGEESKPKRKKSTKQKPQKERTKDKKDEIYFIW
ncbi:MAG: PorV/PorQ family protein [Elusimicrobia bacterium]|nr:PorV/PorQ family protein [Elusimicrobiota bacterium]